LSAISRILPQIEAAAACDLGKNDPFFIPAGAEAFRKDLPNAQVRFLDTGHFATETHVVQIADAMRVFLAESGISPGKGASNAWSSPSSLAP
jgi:hypothetical protein